MSEVDEKQKAQAMVVSALTITFENLMNIDLMYLGAMDKGLVPSQIRNLNELINRCFSIIKHNPIFLEKESKDRYLIDEDKVNEFNDLVDDFFMLDELKKRLRNPDEILTTEDKFYYETMVPKYKERVNIMLKQEVGDKTWEDIGYYDDMYLTKFFLKEIKKLGYELYGQVMISLVSTLPKDEIERITRSLKASRRTEWES